MSVPYLPANSLPNNLFIPILGYPVEFLQSQPNTRQSSYPVPFMKNRTISLGSVFFGMGPQVLRAFHAGVDILETNAVREWCEQKLGADFPGEQTLNGQIQIDSYSNLAESFDFDNFKEKERRRKIGLANKGQVPWNKGRKHSAETLERIRQRTKEAMSNPKVRKKMSECPRAHSYLTKARIRSSQKQLWDKRLNGRRSREKFLISWAESIAKAAKSGGSDQQELDWDSYDKLKKEIYLEQLQWAADRVKAKEITRIRIEKAAQTKAEKMAIPAQKREGRKQRGNLRGAIKRKTGRKSKEEKEELAKTQELKLKERLTKIHRKKSINGQVTSQDDRAWEKFDIQFMKKERISKEASLADQIRAAKKKREELTTSKAEAALSFP